MEIRDYVKRRISCLKEYMIQQGIDTVILQKPENVFYYSNFNPVLNSHPTIMIIELSSEPYLLVHAIRCDHAKEEGAVEQVRLYGKWGSNETLAMRPEEAIGMLANVRGGRLGIESDCISVEFMKQLEKVLQPKEMLSVSQAINMMKIVKDEYEIGKIRRAAKLVDVGVGTCIEYLKQGYSEAEASTEGQYAMRRIWHEQFKNEEVCGFGTSEGGMVDSLHVWCLSGPHIAYGCDCPKHYYPRPGDLTLPMAWAKVSGYHAENERTIIIDSLDSFKQNAYDSMLKARESIFKILKPGTSFEELYEAAATVYTEHGFGSILPGRVGHGVGCSAHEFPSLAKGNKIQLQPGMVLTVEPGLMDREWGGVRHSDTVLVTESGYEFLTCLERETIQITVQ
ncbi:MAG: aminopeptidase P family protein [Clostridium sp.]|nr:aminopeptidase P family protein [Clostridium sp.]